eukprot:scaffold67_cov316-Pinguiococcus_pyrenoidosus.AAC.2
MQTEAWETDRGWWQEWFLQDSPRSFLAFFARGAVCLASDAAALFGRLPPLQISKASGKAFPFAAKRCAFIERVPPSGLRMKRILQLTLHDGLLFPTSTTTSPATTAATTTMTDRYYCHQLSAITITMPFRVASLHLSVQSNTARRGEAKL